MGWVVVGVYAINCTRPKLNFGIMARGINASLQRRRVVGVPITSGIKPFWINAASRRRGARHRSCCGGTSNETASVEKHI
jgi:hypothetical protein